MENLPNRKTNRLTKYDYSQNGCYFVTICTKDRHNILSTNVGGDDLGAPKKIILKPYGKIADKYIKSINTAYESVFVENYIIMPNHIHLLILIDTYGLPRSSAPTLSTIISGFKHLTNKNVIYLFGSVDFTTILFETMMTILIHGITLNIMH